MKEKIGNKNLFVDGDARCSCGEPAKEYTSYNTVLYRHCYAHPEHDYYDTRDYSPTTNTHQHIVAHIEPAYGNVFWPAYLETKRPVMQGYTTSLAKQLRKYRGE